MHYVILSTLSFRPTVWLRGGLSDQPAPATSAGLLDGVVDLLWPTALWAVGVAVAAVALAVGARFLGRSAESAPVEGAATADGASATDTAPAPVTATLDEDEQFVVDLLLANDGRVRQSVVVETSNWSKSKVSRLLSRMERDGYVEKVGVGRENVVVLVETDRTG
jgi:uncharacterized membrane protein